MTESTKTTKTTRGKAPAKKATTGAASVKAGPVKAAAPKKPVAAKAKPLAPAAARAKAKKPPSISPEQRRNYVEIAAYYIAERRGFAPGDTVQDWTAAEAEIDRLILAGMLGRPARD